LRARTQAEQYARALPATEGRPPFLVVVDVGNVVELYAEFSRTGATYTPFPDPRSHRIALADLHDPALRERLRQVWTDPLALDPVRRTARVTREIAQRLAVVAKSLEADGHAPAIVAGFLTRCLFSMFAEDVGLIPRRAFVDLLTSLREHPEQLVPLLTDLWRTMDAGGFAVSVRADLLRFNGKLFKDPSVLPLSSEQIGLLLDAARADWRDGEPAIFGTLLERALDPAERHALGAHYTPRAYVERLVLPTIVEPLRDDWKSAQSAALLLAAEGRMDDACAQVRGFLDDLCHVRVLDPACGSGNFLYVTLEHLKRLEGEVLNQLDALGDTQGRLEAEGMSVDPHQLLGIELNPRAAAVAETVLWIGYLQWHFRTRGQVPPPQPVLKDFHNIECRDAVLAYDRVEFVTDARGVPASRWDGRTYKPHPATGELVPDERAQVPIERYVNPRKAAWPQADFVVGNPPFIGNKRMRDELGTGYVEALREAWRDVPESADFVMYWWQCAAELTRRGALRRFGLITTNSVTMIFNRRVLDAAMTGTPPLALAWAIPDHPWIDAADGAAVRIAMTVAARSHAPGMLARAVAERADDEGAFEVELSARRGRIHSDLSVGADVTAAVPLHANDRLSNRGVIPHGAGFVVTRDEAVALGLGRVPGLDAHLRPYRNGKDLTDRPRDVYVIDFFPLSEDDARKAFPAGYQRLFDTVKPERDQNPRASRRINWWLFGESQPRMRESIRSIRRYIATGHVAKHRFFQFLDAAILPDDKLIAIALDDAAALAVLSSVVHVRWALAAGGRLGVGNDPVYSKSTCFDPFAFPAATAEAMAPLRALGEELDAHRK
ncbi:MAG: class I SAM-dependent DNA methyltransferase, partial [Burkholderiales bacterium]|nr:class I SAM-dependent DNA methyltransferase [Burkholderiales bacterium]